MPSVASTNFDVPPARHALPLAGTARSAAMRQRLPLFGLLIMQAAAIYLAATLLSSHIAAHRGDVTAEMVAKRIAPHTADLSRYFLYSQHVYKGQWPYVDFEMEYPPGALLAMLGPGYAVRNETTVERGEVGLLPGLFVQAAVLSCLSTLVIWRLYRARHDRWEIARRFAVMSVVLTPIAAFRYDTFPMAATIAAVLAMSLGYFSIAGALIGLGVLLKLYPGVVLLVGLLLLVVRRQWGAIVRMGAGFCAVMLLPFVIFAAKSPLAPLSFMRYHSDRGLQAESTWAGFALLARNYLKVKTHMIAAYGALEIKSSWVPVFLTVQHYLLPLATAMTLAYCGWVAWKRRDAVSDRQSDGLAHNVGVDGELAGRMIALLLIVMLLLAKVFSTQYIIWLLPFCVSGSRARLAALMAIALTTLYIFPYDLANYGRMSLGKVICINLRTLLLIALAAETAVWLWRQAKPRPTADQPSDASSASAAAS